MPTTDSNSLELQLYQQLKPNLLVDTKIALIRPSTAYEMMAPNNEIMIRPDQFRAVMYLDHSAPLVLAPWDFIVRP